MNFINHIERLNKIHNLIKAEKTLTPKEFASKLQLSRSQLYNIIEIFKELDARITYCKKKESFYYVKPFDLKINLDFEVINNGEVRKIYGGCSFRPILLDRSLLNLM